MKTRLPPALFPAARFESGRVSRRTAALALTAASVWPVIARAATKDPNDPEGSDNWKKIRASLFGERAISAAGNLMSLEAPVRAEDAAVVPIAVRTSGAAASKNIRKLTLVIDNNPSPIAAVFEFGPASGRADVETRVRVDEYTHVRAIAETSDGRLFMATRFVKASGGCSAPPGKDPQAALATLGKMRMRLDDKLTPGQPSLVQLMISHPNDSGMVMDQATRQFTPSHYVRTVDVSYGGQPVMSADVDFAISENPNFRFYFLPTGQGELKAEVTDTRGLHFESKLAVPTAQ